MRLKYMKALRKCFGTKEYSSKSFICAKCQFKVKCWKHRKKRYKNLLPPRDYIHGKRKEMPEM